MRAPRAESNALTKLAISWADL